MKTTMKKILPLGLAVALLLTGCGNNPVKEAEKAIKKVTKAYKTEVAEYEGGTVTAGEIMADFTTQYSEMVYLYSLYGYELTQSEVVDIMESSMEARVRSEIIANKFDEQYALTEEELAAVEESAKSVYQTNYDSYYAISEGETDEEKDAEVREVLAKLGMDYENTYDAVLLNMKAEYMYNVVGEEITEVDEAQIKANYEEWVTEDSATYYGHPDEFAYAMTKEGVNCYWMPRGFRTVKHILLAVDAELITAYNDAVDAYDAAVARVEELEASKEGLSAGGLEALEIELIYAQAQIEPAQAAIDTALIAMCETVQDKLVDIYTRLANGESFDVLIEEYCEDPSMLTEPTKSRGYYISKDTTIWEPALQEEALALENVGDYSQQPIVTENGLHIVYYASEVASGAVNYEDVHDALYSDALIYARQEHYSEVADSWLEEANASYDVEKFIEAFSTAAE